MKIDYLVIGQGISGSFLSHELWRSGKSFMVIDDGTQQSASRIASGIINPVTGRRIVTTWMIDTLLPFAWNAYRELGNSLGIDCIQEVSNIDFFPTPQMRLAFLDRLQDDPQYISLPAHENDWNNRLNYSFGYGIIAPCYLVNLQALLPAYRKRLLENNSLLEEQFNISNLTLTTNGVRYKELEADKIILCDGIGSTRNPWFRNLPFAPNKGEVLIVEINDLATEHILKRGISIVPWKDNLYWVGSSHEWQFDDDRPTEIFRQKTVAQLQSFLKLPFRIVAHWAAVRPATLERRPFAGFHPVYSQVGILNGMGTKGCSLAPYFASQLVNFLLGKEGLQPEADVDRFRKVLMRG